MRDRTFGSQCIRINSVAFHRRQRARSISNNEISCCPSLNDPNKLYQRRKVPSQPIRYRVANDESRPSCCSIKTYAGIIEGKDKAMCILFSSFLYLPYQLQLRSRHSLLIAGQITFPVLWLNRTEIYVSVRQRPDMFFCSPIIKATEYYTVHRMCTRDPVPRDYLFSVRFHDIAIFHSNNDEQ